MRDRPSGFQVARPAALVLTLLLSGTVRAQEGEPPSTQAILERLQAALANEEGLSAETKAALEGLAASLPVPRERRWEGVLDRLTFYGDLRLRHESSFHLDGRRDRHRERVRMRLGVNHQLRDDLLVGARIVTGSPDDPNSPHSTFGDVFDSEAISLDRAFLTVRPGWTGDPWLTAGKADLGFHRNPVYGELVWDADVQPEGIAAGWGFAGAGPIEGVTVRAGAYVLLEQSSGSEGFVSVAQVEGRIRLGEEVDGRASIAYYGYNDVTPSASTAILADDAGNATVDLDGNGVPDGFVSEFRVFNPIVALSHEGWGQPVTVACEYFKNVGAEIDGDQGWAFGASWGSTKGRGDLRLYYQWQVVEQDAVFSPFAQDDFLFQTNHRSHAFGTNCQLTDEIGLHLWALVSAVDDLPMASGRNQWRVRLDLNVKL